MKIGIFTDTYYPDLNGCAQSCYVLANNLRKIGHEVYIVCSSEKAIVEIEDNIIRLPGVDIKKLYGYKASLPIQSPIIYKELQDLNLDIIHAETEFGVGIYANIFAHLNKIPLVRTYHTDYVDYTHYFVPENTGLIYKSAIDMMSFITKIYGDDCLRLMTPSLKTKKMLISTGIKTPIDVVPNGIELERFNPNKTSPQEINKIRKEYGIKDDEKLLIYVGRIADEKRVDFLLDVFKKVKQDDLKVKLLVIGNGTAFNKINHLVNEYELNDKVIIAGSKSSDDVPHYYHASDGFISASTSETQGLTYIEALSSGLPIIVAYDEVLIDLVNDHQNGVFFKEIDDCFELIKEFCSFNGNKISELKNNAINSVSEFDALKFAKTTEKIYEEVIEEYKTIYKIESIKLKNDLVNITLTNRINEEVKVKVSLDDYYNYGFKKNSIISNELVQKLIANQRITLAYQSALRRLAIKDYSISQMKKSLVSKYQLLTDELEDIINKLISNELLSDEKYVVSRSEYLTNNDMSYKAIVNKLKLEGIESSVIEKYLKADKLKEKDKVINKAKKYFNTVKGKSVKAKKQAILSKLVNDGFDLNISKEALDILDFKNDQENELSLLRNTAQKLLFKYSKKYEGYQIKNHLFKDLLTKGFNVDEINQVITEMEIQDETS